MNYNSACESINLFQILNASDLEDVHIKIIDNNSRTSDREMLEEKIPKSNLVSSSTNRGYAGGNRIGIDLALKSEAEYVLLLNPDIRIGNGCVEKLLQQLSANEEIAVVGPRICYRNDPDTIYSDGGVVYKEKGFYASHKHYKQSVERVRNPGLHEVDYVNGSCFLFRTSAYTKIGPMREDFFLYFEETEWCLRAKKFSYKCMVDSNVVAFHSSSEKNPLYHFYMTRNRILLAKSQKEEVEKTYWIIARPVLRTLFGNFRNLKYPSPETRAKLRGILASIFKN